MVLPAAAIYFYEFAPEGFIMGVISLDHEMHGLQHMQVIMINNFFFSRNVAYDKQLSAPRSHKNTSTLQVIDPLFDPYTAAAILLDALLHVNTCSTHNGQAV